jgi:hypothetical protein
MVAIPFRLISSDLTMKTIVVTLVSLLACVLASTGVAKDPKKKAAVKDVPLPDVVVDEAAVTALKPFDKNGDYQIDKEEFVALAAAFKADPTGPLKQFDLTKKGELDDFVDRAKINNTLGAVLTKKQRDIDEEKRKKRVEQQKAKEAAANK